MSATQDVMLSQDQASKILEYAISEKMYEVGPAGIEGVSPETKLSDAATLVFQARRAWDNGNRTDGVKNVLFLAEVDLAPQTPQAPAAALEPVVPPSPVPTASAPTNGDPGLVDSSPEALLEALKVFQAHPSSPAIESEIARINAELQRRANAQAPQAPSQPIAAPTAPTAPVPVSGPVTPDASGLGGAPSPDPVPQTLPPAPGHPSPRVESAGGVATPIGAPPADAAVEPGSEVAQPSEEGQLPAAQPDAQAGGDRAALEGQLTLAMMQAYGLSMEAAKALTDEQLQAIIANPGGPQPQLSVFPGQTTETSSPSASGLSPERDALEGQVTGPMLKAYRRGRVDIINIGDAELRLMVEHPDGQVSAEQLAAARAQDSGTQEQPAAPQPAVDQVLTPPAPVPMPPPVVPEQPVVAVPTTAPPATTSTPPPIPRESTGRESALAIIERENLPVPQEIDGDPPKFPNDVSRVSDVELYSLHARFHACESRTNWLINQREDEIHDAEKLLRNRRREVRNGLPKTNEGKKLTKDDIESLVEEDAEVQRLLGELDAVEGIVRTLRVLRDNYKSDVAVCSRQASMRFGEERGVPGR